MVNTAAFLDGYLSKTAQSVDMLARGVGTIPMPKGVPKPGVVNRPVPPAPPVELPQPGPLKPQMGGRPLSFPGQQNPRPPNWLSSEIVPPPPAKPPKDVPPPHLSIPGANGERVPLPSAPQLDWISPGKPGKETIRAVLDKYLKRRPA